MRILTAALLVLILTGCGNVLTGPLSENQSPERSLTRTGTVYYVDSAAGNDDYSGTSQSTPWKSFKWLNGMTLNPGDKVLLRSGSSWNESLTLRGKGTEEAPITLSSYGEGNRPLIYGNDIKKDVCVTIEGASWWNISNLDLRNGKLGLYLRYINDGDNRSVSVENCNFRDFPDTVADAGLNNFEYAWSAGIFVGGLLGPQQNYTVLDGLTVRNNSFHNTGIGVISSWYFPDVYKRRLVNVLVEDNTADYCYGGGFAFTYASDVTVKDFTITNSGGASHFGTTGGFLQSTDNVTIEYCELAYTRAIDCHDGVGMDFEGNNSNTVFRYNYVHSNDGPGILFCTTEGTNSSVDIYENVIFNNGQNPYNDDYKFELLNWTERNGGVVTGYNGGNIYNNIIQRYSKNDYFSNGTATAGVPFEWNGFNISGNSESRYRSWNPPSRPLEPQSAVSEVLWDFAYDNDILGWNGFNNWSSNTVSEDVLWGQATGNDMYMVSEAIRFDAGTADAIEISMKNSHSLSGQIFFITESDPDWDAAKSLTFNLKPGQDMETYLVNMSSNAQWNGIITAVRIDPSHTSGETLSIDYIRIGKPEQAWEFDTVQNTEGWNGFNNWDSMSVSNSNLWGLSSGVDMFGSSPDFNLSALHKTIEIHMNISASDSGAIYFKTAESPWLSGDKMVTFDLVPGSYNRYVVDMSSCPLWTGTITGIRLDPTMTAGQTLGIDSIRIY